jgi:hypothetical protein
MVLALEFPLLMDKRRLETAGFYSLWGVVELLARLEAVQPVAELVQR